MSEKKLVLRGSALLLLGQIVGNGCSFIRNIILARFLTKADFGIAATFAMAVQLVDLAGKFSIGMQVVQAKDGNNERFMASAHLFQFLISSLSASILLLFAPAFAVAFKIPDATWAFQLLAIIPFMKGCENLDVQRRTRDLDYKGVTFIEVIAQIVITLATVPFCRVFPDYRSILFLLIAKSGISLTTTFLFAQRKYKWHFELRHIKHMVHFGWPLFVNGILMFGIMQGDQMIVAIGYTMSDLGGYSIAGQLTLIPGLMFLQIINGVMLPILSRLQDKKDEFYEKYKMCFNISGLFSTIFTIFIILFGGYVAVLFFGKKYSGLGVILSWLAMANATKLMRSAPTIAALALGDTKNNMYSNFIRALGILLGLSVVLMKMPLWTLAATSFVAELFAISFSLFFFTYKYQIKITYAWYPMILLILSSLVAGIYSSLFASNHGILTGLIGATILFFGLLFVNVYLHKPIRLEVCNQGIILIKGIKARLHPTK
jgi:O-antigen/teichoic acid export membrane protein